MSQNTISIQLTKDESVKLKDILLNDGWFEEDSQNEYISMRMKNKTGSVCNLYTSMKVVFQGNEDFTNIVNMIKNVSEINIKPHIGVDEVGKGDYFGPLVVVSCFVDRNFLKRISGLGILDSKKLSDKKIRKIYEIIRNYEYYYKSIVHPSEYNELNKKLGNVSILLAKQHSKVIEMGLKDLKDKGVECNRVVIDQFSSRESRVKNELGDLGRSVEFVQFHKGESDIAVACASVLARGIFLEQMDLLNDKYYFSFPKGASSVIEKAQEFVERHGVEELEKVAKISFKTTKKVLQTSF